MDEFKESFYEDAKDLLNQLETALLSLEANPEDSEIIEEIFRVMHTIKGAANMFGYEKIGSFTHDMETIYDAIRNKEIKIDNLVLELTFKSVDHIYAILEDAEISIEANVTTHQQLNVQIQEVISEIEQKRKSNDVETALKVEDKEDANAINTYYIVVRPNETINRDEGHPITFVMEDLIEQGEHKLTAHPVSKEDAPVSHWSIYLATSTSAEEIKDQFIFVEDDCTLEVHKLANFNILAEQQFIEKTIEIENNDIPVNIEKLQSYVNELLAQIRDNQLKEIESVAKQQEPLKKNKDQGSTNIKVATEKVDQLVNLVSELVTMQASLQSISDNHKIPELQTASESLDLIASNLRDTIFSISLLPLETITVQLKRLVRSLSQELNKEIEFVTEGVDTELNKTIIETLSDPLIHILRNCMDHGLETAEEREKAGKPAKGTVTLKAYHSGANIYIEISDDGRGIDPAKIRNKAVQKGLITAEDQLSAEESFELLFKPGFSTAEKVTDVSGRGVGMDVVKKKIREVRGNITIQSEVGVGTTLIIQLPMSLSILDGLLTEVDGSFFVLPLNLVQRIDEVPYAETNLEEKFLKTITIAEKQLPILSIRDAFGLHQRQPNYVSIVNVQNGEETKGIVVDEVMGEIQAVLKPLGRMYSQQDYLSGSTILGDGNIALVLDTNKLLNQYAN